VTGRTGIALLSSHILVTTEEIHTDFSIADLTGWNKKENCWWLNLKVPWK
jgi:hypothetical protein